MLVSGGGLGWGGFSLVHIDLSHSRQLSHVLTSHFYHVLLVQASLMTKPSFKGRTSLCLLMGKAAGSGAIFEVHPQLGEQEVVIC